MLSYRVRAEAPSDSAIRGLFSQLRWEKSLVGFVMISGCSGGGKSALIAKLRDRGQSVITEPGRRIVAEERERGGVALPWVDPVAFAERAVEMSTADYTSAMLHPKPVFFDRGVIDALAALEHASGMASLHRAAGYPYHQRVFLAPPWREIFAPETDRRHGFRDAVEEYERLHRAFVSLGYEVEILPKAGLEERADLVLDYVRRNQPDYSR